MDSSETQVGLRLRMFKGFLGHEIQEHRVLKDQTNQPTNQPNQKQTSLVAPLSGLQAEIEAIPNVAPRSIPALSVRSGRPGLEAPVVPVAPAVRRAACGDIARGPVAKAVLDAVRESRRWARRGRMGQREG